MLTRLFSAFLQEKQCLQNVSPNTLRWYRHALAWLPCEQPDAVALKQVVIKMGQQGLKPTGCNAALRAINCYLRWSGSAHRVQKLREPQCIMPTFTNEQVRVLVGWKPRTDYDRRLHLLVLILLDTGCRISEALSVTVADCDLDNLLVTLNGKGQKQRRVPFSFELRKALFRFIRDYRQVGPLFVTVHSTAWGRMSALRSVKLLCVRLGFKPPARTLHAFRHTFAVNYVRQGGSVFHLQKMLGHSSLEMSRRYANLLTEDLQAVHQRVSLLAA